MEIDYKLTCLKLERENRRLKQRIEYLTKNTINNDKEPIGDLQPVSQKIVKQILNV